MECPPPRGFYPRAVKTVFGLKDRSKKEMKKLPLQFLGFLVGAIAVLLMAVMPRTQAHSIEQANTFGQIIALPGHINDVALDEVRQLVYAGGGILAPGGSRSSR